MLRGVLRGKFELTEDQLTSTVLGYLDLLPAHFLLSFLASAQPASPTTPPLVFGTAATHEVFGWPRTTRHGEPDVLCFVRDRNHEQAIIVEVKHGSMKSQWRSNQQADDEATRLRYDQLVRYSHALEFADFEQGLARRVNDAESHAVVYLTGDASPPAAELNDSMALNPAMRLHWLSWHDLADVLTAASQSGTAPAAEALLRLMNFLGFRTFAGFGDDRFRDPVSDAQWLFHHSLFDRAATPAVREVPHWRYATGEQR